MSASTSSVSLPPSGVLEVTEEELRQCDDVLPDPLHGIFCREGDGTVYPWGLRKIPKGVRELPPVGLLLELDTDGTITK